MTLRRRCRSATRRSQRFDCSCFDGDYITGDITAEYLDRVEASRAGGKANKQVDDEQMELDLAMSVSSM